MKMAHMDPLVLALLAAAAVLAQPNYRYSCMYYCHAGGYERVQPLVYCCRAALLHYSHTPGADINNLPSGPECPPARGSCPMHTLRIGRPPLSCEEDADCALNEKCCVDDCVNQQVCTMAVQRPSQHTCLSGIQHPASACSHNAAAARTSDVETDESSKDDENYFINVKGNHNSAKDNTGSFKNDRATIMSQDGDHTRENSIGYAHFKDVADNLLDYYDTDNYDLDYDYYDTNFHIPL